MIGIYTFKDEGTFPAVVERMYGTHGPHTLNGKRLDCLTNVQILANSSTSTTIQTGDSISHAKSGSMLGRAAVGGVLLGGTGAAVGAMTGKRELQSNAISNETLNIELTAELSFNDGSSMYVLLKSMESFHWLLSYVGKEPLTDEKLMAEKMNAEAEAAAEEAEEEAAAEKLIENRAKLAIRKEKSIGYRKKISWLILFLLCLKFPEGLFLYILLAFIIAKYPEQPLAWIICVITLLMLVAGGIINLPLDNETSTAQKTTSLKENIATQLEAEKSIAEAKSIRSTQQTRIKEILTTLKTIPVSEYEKNNVLYKELLTYEPQNELYRDKVFFYTKKLAL